MSSPTANRACPSGEQRPFNFLVIGAGPAGLTAVGKLIDHGVDRIAWVDPSFSAGRIGERFTEVPSNTKIQLFIDYVHSSPTFSKLVQQVSIERPNNAYSTLESLERDRGNLLKYASDLFMMLTDELIRSYPEDFIKSFRGRVRSVDWDEKIQEWNVDLDCFINHQTPTYLKVKKIILATGAEPRKPSSHYPIMPHPDEIDLEVALSPSKLLEIINQVDLQDSSIAVIGSSHSALLVLKNLIDLSRHLSIVHIYRSELKFAEYRDGWILYDNTGLKGLVADWAKVEYPRLVDQKRIIKFKPATCDDDYFSALATTTKTKTRDPQDPGLEEEQDHGDPKRLLKQCSRVIYAIGYRSAKTLKVSVDGIEVESLTFDNLTGRFEKVPQLFGCGIGFPERVVDPLGNEELAVGVFKFMKFLNRVVACWIHT